MSRDELYERLRQYVIPLYLPQDAGNLKGGVDPEGSGCLLEVEDETFLLTASHVLEAGDDLLYPIGDEGAATVSGDRLRAAPDQDEYDLGFIRLDGPPPDPGIRRLQVKDIFLRDTPEVGLGIACGYPASKNKNRHRSPRAKRTSLSIELPFKPHSDYGALNPHHHVALHYDKREWKGRAVPALRGMSGGPIWLCNRFGCWVIGLVQHYVPAHKLVHGTKVTLGLGFAAGAFPHLAPLIPVNPPPQELIRRV